MKRILHVVSCLEKGGTEAYIMNHFRRIDRSKYSFDFMSFTNRVEAYQKEIEDLGGRLFVVGLPKISHIFKFVRSVVKCIKENGPYDVVHAHINITNAWVIFAAAIAGVPVRISHSHDTAGKEAENIFRKLLVGLKVALIKMFATEYLACSKDAGVYLYGRKLFASKGRVMNNGIDITPFLAKDEERVRELKRTFCIEDEIVFGNISRFDAKKNSLYTVDVFKEILKIQPKSVLLLGGVDGGMLEDVKNRVRQYGIEQQVRFIGMRNDINDCLALMDLYLFPSLYEGLGIVLLEAQASGVYCCASTGVSREADMGLDLMEYLDLELGADEWAKRICAHLHYTKPTKQQIEAQFDEKGYRIEASVRLLEQVYNQIGR